MTVPVTDLVIRASVFARRAHEGQTRKYGGDPYIAHPARVAGETALLPGATEETVAAAWLHDVVEDTAVTLDDIRREFGDRVAELVGWPTNPPKTAGENRAARKAKTSARLADAPGDAKRIKMLDRIDNLRDTDPGNPKETAFARLYAAESRALLEAVGDADEILALRLLGAIEELEKRLPAETEGKTA